MHLRSGSISRALAAFAVSSMLLAPHAGKADALTNYSVQVIARQGDTYGDRTFQHGFHVGQLNASGQLVFGTGTGDGGAGLIQYSDGKFTPIMVAGGPAPNGKTWPRDAGFWGAGSMNEAGNVVFAQGVAPGINMGVYLWDFKTQTVLPAATPGMPTVNSLVFAAGGDHGAATINNRGDVAFVGFIKKSGQLHSGTFVRRADGQIQAIALPGDSLPGKAGKVVETGDTNINDAGLVSFAAVGTQGGQNKVYLWENGTSRVVAEAGTVLPGFGKYYGGIHFGVTKNGSVLIDAVVKNNGPFGMFLWKDGQFTTILLPDQLLPGGGNYDGDPFPGSGPPNAAGQYPLMLPLRENGEARAGAYLVGEDGKVTLIAKDGMTTDLGAITHLGGNNSGGIALNSKGQVALTAQIDNGPDVLLLLTPKAP